VNGAGKDTADDVVVMVTEVRRLEDSGDAIAEARPIALPLTWSGSNPPRATGSVHPGSERHIDLLHVDWPRPGRDRDRAKVVRNDAGTTRPDAEARRRRGEESLSLGAYEISVEIRARNADAIRYAIPVYWDGRWSGKDAMWDHLRVEPPRKLR
jgi:hypothetical protein